MSEVSKNKDKVTHKELLTFSNLTNLEWEFVNLEDVGEEERNSNQLNALLDPEVFVRKDENDQDEDRTESDTNESSDNVSYVYGERNELGEYKKETGYKELREEAGIAMEYLEHSGEDEEGAFIKDWEVIYGADNYKVVKDYLDYKWSRIAGQVDQADEDTEIYPSREEVKENERWQARLQFLVDMGGLALSIKGASAPKESLSSLVSDVNLSDLAGEFTGNLSNEYGALAIGAGLVFNVQDPAKILKQSLGLAEQKILTKTSLKLQTNIA